jgi:hypothetical protein
VTASGPVFTPGHYVAALRQGIRTTDGLEVQPDAPVFFLRQAAPATVEEGPPLPPEDCESLNQLRGIYAGKNVWTGRACEAAGLAAPCWIPVPGQLVGAPQIPSAFEVVNGVFPVSELVSIQTFTIAH